MSRSNSKHCEKCDTAQVDLRSKQTERLRHLALEIITYMALAYTIVTSWTHVRGKAIGLSVVCRQQITRSQLLGIRATNK